MSSVDRMTGTTASHAAPSLYADEAEGPFHHLAFIQAGGAIRDGRVYVPSHWNGNLRAYGALIPGTCVVLPEDEGAIDSRSVPLDPSLRPLLLRGFSTRNFFARAFAYWRARTLIRRLVSEASFVQIQHVASLGFIAGVAAVDLRKTLYVDLGGTLRDPAGASERRPWRSSVARVYYRRAEERIAQAAKLLIAVNPHLHETFPPSDAAKVVVSHSMVQDKDIHQRSDACTGDSIELFVATRMVESKGIQHLIRAVQQLRDRGTAVTLKIAGEGVYRSRLEALVAELQLESAVRFLGGIPVGTRLWTHYRKADIVVLPSLGHYEGTPRMIIEAWAAGAPVIATRVGGIPTMVNHAEDGILVEPADEAALARAVTQVSSDSALCSRLVSHGYQRVKAMTYEGRLPLLRTAFEAHLPGLLPEAS